MIEKFYRFYNRETGKTIAWLSDIDDLLYLSEWYESFEVNVDYDEYRLVKE